MKIINRQTYRSARQTDLVLFTENLIQRVKEKPELAFLTEEVAAMEAPLAQYISALAASRNKGILEIAVKNEARTVLVEALESVANKFENHPEASDILALSAGFNLHEPLTALDALPTPKVIKTQPTGNRGELRIMLKTWQGRRPRAYMHAGEYSTDEGKTWQNGQYSPSQRFVMSGLPPYSSLLVRFRIIAPNGKTGNWSEIVPAVVS
ncbi:MAG: hypothetical protein SFV22_06445 [Saprospiraceae bacterium]|nr:hypothetical protein [Saprospiraceae bacterium]